MHTLDLWHDILNERDVTRLDEVLAEDCVFLSPVVHTPQVGREITKLYLAGAMNVLNKNEQHGRNSMLLLGNVLKSAAMALQGRPVSVTKGNYRGKDWVEVEVVY